MATNRYDRSAYSSSLQDLPLMQLPFEHLNQVAAQAQQEKNMFDQASQLGFKYLQDSPSDSEWATKAKQYQDNLQMQLTDIASKGDVGAYRNELQKGIMSIAKMRQPGGVVHALENRYDQYHKVKEELYEKYKKDPSSINYEYALNQFTPGDINYDIDRGTFSQIAAPNVQTYIDLRKELEETAKAMIPAEEEISYIKDGWVWTKSGKQYDIRGALQGFFSDETVQNQLNIETWAKTRNLPPLTKELLINEANRSLKEKATIYSEGIQKIEALFNSSNSIDIMELQTYLKEQGLYDGKIDGISGPQTQEGVNAILLKLNQEVNKLPTSYSEKDIPNLIKNSLEENYSTYLGALRPASSSNTIRMANWKAKLNATKQVQQELISAFTSPQDADLFVGYTTADPIDLEKKLNDAISAKQEIRMQINDQISNFTKAGVFTNEEKIDKNKLKSRYLFLDNLSNGNIDLDEQVKKYAAEFKIPEDVARKQVITLTKDDANLRQNLEQELRLESTLNNIESSQIEIGNQYLEKNGPNAVIKAWDKLQDKTPINILNTPYSSYGLSQTPAHSYTDYREFKQDFIKGKFKSIAIDNFLRPDVKRFKKLLKEDIEKNPSEYKSAINYSISSEDAILKDLENTFVDAEKKGFFDKVANQNGDPSSYVNKNGKAVDEIDEKTIRASVSQMSGETTINFSAKDLDGNDVTKVVALPPGPQQNFVGKRLKSIAAKAIQNQRPQDLLTLLPMIYPDDILTISSYSTIEPSSKKPLSIYQGTNVIFDGVNSQILKKYGDLAAVVIKSPTSNQKKYYIGKFDEKNNSLELINDVQGNQISFIDGRTAVANLLAYKFTSEDLQEYQGELKEDKIILPEDTKANVLNSIIGSIINN